MTTAPGVPAGRGRTGALGEDLAVRYLQRQGMTIVERNYRCRHGEIDVVAQEAGELVFVEVRTRRGDSFGSPEESITGTKARRMAACAHAYLAERRPNSSSWRLDLVAIKLDRGRVDRLDHYRHVIEQ
jgi:putative endonuclease